MTSVREKIADLPAEMKTWRYAIATAVPVWLSWVDPAGVYRRVIHNRRVRVDYRLFGAA